MKIIDPGHQYIADYLDNENKVGGVITFVKREGNKYPGNIGHHPGTNLQDVIRILIDRVKYLDNQINHDNNKAVIDYLRRCIWLLEDRAAQRHNRGFDISWENIEMLSVCSNCGHIGCIENCH